MATTELAVLPTTSNTDQWTPDQLALMGFAGAVKKEGAGLVYAPADVIMGFLHQCAKSGLDPAAKQIYLIYRGGKWTIQGAIDGFRVVAKRYKDYAGQETQWSADGIVWVDAWVSKENPAAARTMVYMKGVERPTVAVALWSEFAVVGKGGENWLKMPAHMLGKVSESHALRKAFPNDLSGIYTSDEMGNDELAAAADTSRDWEGEAECIEDVAELTILFDELKTSGGWNKYLDGKFRARRATILMAAEEAPPTIIQQEEAADVAE